ncbi:gluconate 5-dehydrogenase [Azospirillum sp. TSH100]|uniref:SDR family oxidoreductase n=1 Tax=Azospirillum sp. TSH100 TaxID=652764 RepID=UPI000D61447F|nr:SDR family oxidoreductase [Azospirillum sp. TSH100]PWC91356.1 gluconate 5-dehydrogenase [Azospirillum sp. TSH100]QCG89221.1 SDR family oxidoreductase [Azospirillum sp. TSH100]
MTTMFDLSGKTALVTGSARGLGNAIAEGLAEAGAAIILSDINPDTLADAAARARDKGYTVHESAFDVTDEDAVAKAFARFDEQGISVDILVNNAGIQIRSPLVDFPVSDFRKVIDTNLTSAFLVGREAGRRMVARRAGKIINIGSLTSEQARVTVAPYAAAKGGIRLLTKSMTAEWAEFNVQINAIGPGYIVTEMNKPLIENEEFDGWVKKRTPARRWGNPSDLVGTAVFLASPASDFVNGQLIFVDGGIMAVY